MVVRFATRLASSLSESSAHHILGPTGRILSRLIDDFFVHLRHRPRNPWIRAVEEPRELERRPNVTVCVHRRVLSVLPLFSG